MDPVWAAKPTLAVASVDGVLVDAVEWETADLSLSVLIEWFDPFQKV